jgi:Domain of unknown function (DUF4403)
LSGVAPAARLFGLLAFAAGFVPGVAAAQSPSGASPPDSVVTLSAFLSYADLQKIGEAKIPATFPVSGAGKGACIKLLGQKVCTDYRWSADIRKDGPLTIAQSGAAIRLRQPLYIVGKAALDGAIKMRRVEFDAHATPMADVTVDMSPQWCPVPTVSPVGRWIDSAGLGPVDINLGGALNEVIEHRHAEIEQAAQKAVPCDRIRARFAEVWRPISVKLPLADGDPLYLDITPKSAAASRLVAGPDGVRLTARVGAQADLAPAPAPADPLPLPPLGKTDPGDAQLQANLTLVSPIDLLKARLVEKLVGRDFRQTTSLGVVSVHIEDVDVRASGSELAVKLKVSARTPTSALDTSGSVELTGRPIVADGGAGVKIVDLKYVANLDNSLWQAAQSVLQGEVLSEIAAHSDLDLSKRIDDAEDRISNALAKADVRGVKLKAGKPHIVLAGVQVTPAGLAATAIVAMALDIQLTADLIQP